MTQLEQLVELAQTVVDLLSDLVRLVGDMHEIGQVPMQEVHLVRADLFAAEDALRHAQAGRLAAGRSLEVLLGRYPAAEIEAAPELPAVPPPVPAGVPADILPARVVVMQSAHVKAPPQARWSRTLRVMRATAQSSR